MNEKSDILKAIVSDLSELRRVENPGIFDELIARYPFFQTLYLLRILHSNQQNSIFIQDQLSHTAVYTGSRAKLLNYLKNKTPFEPIPAFSPKTDNLPAKIMQTEADIKKTVPKSDEPTNEISVPLSVIPIDPLPKTERREKAENIIDKFIREQPSIQKPLAEFYSATVMAAKSLAEDEELVTETLAQIYMKQENYRKAIKIYEKLSLLYPEKSDKFALLIENAKNKITE